MAGVTVVEDYNPPAGGVSVVEDVDGPPDGGVPAPMQEAYARVAELGAGMEDILPAPENLIGLTADALVSGVPKISQKVQQYLSSYQIPQGSPELNFGDLNDLVAGGRKRTLRDGDWQQRQQGAIDEQQFGPKYHNIADFERDVEEATTDKEREDALRRLARAKNENVWARDFRNAQEAKWKQREAELGRGRLSPEERYQQELYDFEMSQGPTARLWNSPPVRGLVSGINTIASTIVGSGADVLGAVGVDSASSFADQVREDMADDAEYNAIANINQGKVGSYTQQGVEMLTKYAPWGPAGRMLGEIAGVSNAMTAFIFGEARQSALQEAKKAGLKGGKAQAYAAAVGGANAAFTLIGGKAASKLGGKTTEQILSSLVKEGAAAAAASSTVKGRAKEIFKWAGTQIRDGGIEFGIEELPTAYAENLARYLAGMKDGVNPSAEEILDIFAMTMLMRGTAGGIDAASSLRDFSENPTQANATAANIPGKVAPTQADRERLAKIAGYLTGKMTIDTPAAPTAEGMEAGVEDFTARDRYKFAESRRRANAPEEAARAAAEADRLAAERAAQMEAGVQPYSGPYYRPGQSGWGPDEDVTPTPGEAERMDRQSAATAAAMEAGVVSPYPPNIAEPESLSPEEREALATGRPLPGKKRQGAAKVAKAEMQPGDLVRMRSGGYAEVQGTEGDWVDILAQDGTEYRVRRREIAQHWGPRSSEPSTGPETPPDASDQGPPPEMPPGAPTQPEDAQEPTEAPQQNSLEQLSPEELGGVFGIDMEPAPQAPAPEAPPAAPESKMDRLSRERREKENERNIRTNNGLSPDEARGWMADAVRRAPTELGNDPNAIAQWMEKGFGNKYYWKLLKENGQTLPEAVASLLAPAKPAEKTASVKAMMTQSDRQALRDLGWTQEQIRSLTPQQGAEAIANSQGPPQSSVAPAEAPGAVPPAAPVTSGVAAPTVTAKEMRAIKPEDVPEDLLVDVKVVRETTGEVVTMKKPAREALEELEAEEALYKKILGCLGK